MARVVIKSLKSGTKSKGVRRIGTSVKEKRVRDTAGRVKTLRTLDTSSRTFGADLHYVFGRNVAKARRDNKRATGSTDIGAGKR